jgi:hypothetical protein
LYHLLKEKMTPIPNISKYVAAIIAGMLARHIAIAASTKNPPCYICHGESNASIENPQTIIDVSVFTYLPIKYGSCEKIVQMAVTNRTLSEQDCSKLLANKLVVERIQEPCGCSSIGTVITTSSPSTYPVAKPKSFSQLLAPTPIQTKAPTAPSSVSILPSASTNIEVVDPIIYSPCFLCNGDPFATISKPDRLIDLKMFETLQTNYSSCSSLFNKASSGVLVSDDDCSSLLVDRKFKEYVQSPCGCSNLGSTQVPVSTSPVRVPTVRVLSSSPVALPTYHEEATIAPTAAPVTPSPSPNSPDETTESPVTSSPSPSSDAATEAPVTSSPSPSGTDEPTTAPTQSFEPTVNDDTSAPQKSPSVRKPAASSIRKPAQSDFRI